jgi:hypothetical protein
VESRWRRVGALLNYGRLEEQLPSITEWLPALDGSILALTLPNL